MTHKNEVQQKLGAWFFTYCMRIRYNPGLKLQSPKRK